MIMLFKKALSSRIEELCSEKNITVNKLSEMSTVPPSTLRDIVNCKVDNPSSTVIYQVCKTLKISLKDFYDSKLFDFNKLED